MGDMSFRLPPDLPLQKFSTKSLDNSMFILNCDHKGEAVGSVKRNTMSNDSTTDKLEAIFKAQSVFNKRLGIELEGLSDNEKTLWILNYSRAMQQELAELTDSVPWKWWASYQEFDEQNARVEVVDLFHFLVSLAQVLGMSAEDLYEAYLEKNKVNHERQNKGYLEKSEGDSRHIRAKEVAAFKKMIREEGFERSSKWKIPRSVLEGP